MVAGVDKKQNGQCGMGFVEFFLVSTHVCQVEMEQRGQKMTSSVLPGATHIYCDSASGGLRVFVCEHRDEVGEIACDSYR